MTTPFDEEQEEDTKQTEEQFLLEPTQTKNGARFVMVNTHLDYQHRSQDLTALCLYDFVSHFHKKLIDKSDRRLIKSVNESEGERLDTEGTKMNERYTFESAHPQASSHIVIKHTNPVVPVLVGPQIPRQEREEARERYSRALLTLFVPWRSVHDLCALNQTWTEALEVQKPLISPVSLKIIENIQLLHELSDRPLYHSCTSAEQITERQIDMQCAQKLISQMNCVVELSQQMRTEDLRYLDLLNRLRSGQSTIEDYQLLCTRIVGNSKLQASLRQKPWNEAPILVFRNTLRTQINNRAVLNKAMEMGLRPMVRVAQDYFQGKIIDDLRLRKTILELPDNKTEHLPGYLPLVPGMPVLPTENVAKELGLSNGTRGIFHQLVYEESSADIQFQDKNFPTNTKFITQPKYALVEFPNCKLDSELAELQAKIIPIPISEQTFLFDVKELLAENVAKAAKINKKTTKISIKRKALPLIPAYSMTTHKSQGQTLGKIIIDLVMPPGPVEVASAYVPLSRVKRLDDLLIIRPFEFAALQVKPSTAKREELKRLDQIAKTTPKCFPISM
ncbi:unnamed protein product [Rotaria magnacalcarata]|uniref:DNA helicase n=4 Tax=Rotaria magnacalcarata TaxID=392030 RepID=A0A815L6P6_9BILA|nr:unnamed protein product [Rotaria magnacalcarata]